MELLCDFCKARPATLLCDGQLAEGGVCSKNLCPGCTHRDSVVHLRLSRAVAGSRCRWETIDRCPECVERDRKTTFGGLTRSEINHLQALWGLAPDPQLSLNFRE